MAFELQHSAPECETGAIDFTAVTPPDGSSNESVSSQRSATMGRAEVVLKGEDASALLHTTVQDEELYCALVADGHGGKEVSLFLKERLLDMLFQALEEDEGAVPTGAALRRAGERAFVRAHEEILAEGRTTAGSTLTVCIANLTRDELTTLHSGDSVARLVGQRKTSVALCEDHRLETSSVERKRVVSAGGEIGRAVDAYGHPAGPLRAWPGGVAQARAIGDSDVGSAIEPRPHAQTVSLPEDESCVVAICSDGVWDALLPSAVDSLLRASMANTPDAAAQSVTNSSTSQRHAYSSNGDHLPRDDTTAVIMRIEHANDPFGSRGKGCTC
jgi:serine/threonine protein phosphatase PrpC